MLLEQSDHFTRAAQSAQAMADSHRRLLAAAGHAHAESILESANSAIFTHAPEMAGMLGEEAYRLAALKEQAEQGYTIALFGRTGVGKSTLAAILTNSDEPTIGKGAQRTTQETTAYHWNGLTVLDTPGIAAAGESNDENDTATLEAARLDERKALEAAQKSDMVVFIASEDAPSATEAKFLAQLDHLGKYLLAITNCKQTIASPDDRDEFLLYADMGCFNERDLRERQSQFEEYTARYTSRPTPQFQPAHFQAQLEANRADDPELSKQMSKASRMEPILETIRQEAILAAHNGALKTPADLVLTAIHDRSRALMAESQLADKNAGAFAKAKQEFQLWTQEFQKTARSEIDALIGKEITRPIRSQIPSFAQRHAEASAAESKWRQLVQSKIDAMAEPFNKLLEQWEARLRTKTQNVQLRLKDTIEFNQGQSDFAFINLGKIFDTRRWSKWFGRAGASATTIAGAILGQIFIPIPGWGAFIGGIAGSVVGAAVNWISGLIGGKSKKDKLAEQVASKRADLNNSLADVERNIRQQMHSALNRLRQDFNDQFNQQLADMESDSSRTERVNANIASELQSLARHEHHQLVLNTLRLQSPDADAASSIHAVGRVPGQLTVLMGKPNRTVSPQTRDLLNWILKEPVQAIAYENRPDAIVQKCLGDPNMRVHINDSNGRLTVNIPAIDQTVGHLNAIKAAELLGGFHIYQSEEQRSHER